MQQTSQLAAAFPSILSFAIPHKSVIHIVLCVFFFLSAINYESRYEKLKIDYSGQWKTNLNAAVGLMTGLLPPPDCQTKPITIGAAG